MFTRGFVLQIHGFILFCGSQIQTFKGSIRALQNYSGFIRICKSESLMFSKDLVCGFKSETDLEQIWTILTNPKNPHESLVHRRTMNKSESTQILSFGFATYYGIQKICFVDLISPMVFKLPITWIRFKTWLLKYPFCAFV